MTDTNNKMLTRFLPLVLFFLMAALFAILLMDEDRNPQIIKSALIGKPVPKALNLPALYKGQDGIAAKDLSKGKVIVVNFFASWCIPCRAEHDNLVKLAARDDVTLYGIAYKDKEKASKAFLTELGNPYDRVGVDKDGFGAGIDFGISGVPETFIINGDGRITFRYTGPIITEANMNNFLAELEKAK